MNNNLVSIIVPTFNRRWLLSRTLQSLLSQSYQNIEIIVINDSGENVVDIIEQYNDKRIKYFYNAQNLGLAGSRNVGLKNATGDYICLCDDDDIYLQYAIETRMYYLQKLNAEIVYTRALKDIWQKVDNGYTSVKKELYWDCSFNRDLILIQNIAPCNCVLFSRKSWENADYWYDEDLSTSEDFDFWIALSRNHDFHELKLIDCEDSFRMDNSQMTGSRNFVKDYPVLYKRWRHTADNINFVIEKQNAMLQKMGLNPEDYNL